MDRVLTSLLLVAALAANAVRAQTSESPISSADAILYNGKILTVDASFSTAQAVAVSKDKILRVGNNDAYVQAFKTLEARGELPLRIGYGLDDLSGATDLDRTFQGLGKSMGEGSQEMWTVGVALQALDGSGSRECSQVQRKTQWPMGSWWPTGECLLEPEYRGARGNYFKEHLKALARHDVRFANTHVAGDWAHKQLLDILRPAGAVVSTYSKLAPKRSRTGEM